MNSKLSRFLAFFLSIIMLISTLASCSSGLDNYYGNSGVPNTEIGNNESDSDISSDISSDINDDTTNKKVGAVVTMGDLITEENKKDN